MEFLSGKPLLNQKLKVVLANDALEKSNLLVLLFTTKWCRYIQDLTAKLIEIHEESKRRESGIEIINIPLDHSLQDMMDNFSTQGNWYSLIHGDILCHELVWTYNITHVPTVIVMTKDGKVITKNGYKEVMDIGQNVLVTWT